MPGLLAMLQRGWAPAALTTLDRVRQQVLAGAAMLAVFLCWLAAKDQPWAMLCLGAATLGMGFLAPVWGLTLMAMVLPFEQAREWQAITVHTGEALLVLLLPGAFWQLMRHPGWRRPAAPVLAWSAGFLAILLASTLLHASAITLKGAIRWLEFFAVLGISTHLLRSGRDAERVLTGLLLAAVMSAGMGFMEFAGRVPGSLPIAWAGQTVVRAGAGFGPNTLAVFLAMLWPWAASMALFGESGHRRGLGIVSTGVLTAGLLATFSLTGVIAWLAGILAWAALLQSAWFRPWRLSLAVLGLAGLVLWLKPEALSTGFWTTKFASLHDRWQYAAVVGRMLEQAPWLGWGPGLYRFVAPAFGSPEVNVLGLITYPHALWLTVLAETGVLGLAGLLAFGVAAGRWMFRRLALVKAAWPFASSSALLAGGLGFAVANLAEHCLIHDRGMLAALFLASLLVCLRRPSRAYPPEHRRLFEAAWVAPVQVADQALAERSQGRDALYRLIDASLAGKPAARVLELGCGPAWDALQLASRPGLEVHGLDSSAAALQQAEAAAAAIQRRLHLHRADLRHTGLASAAYDLVYSQGVLEHFPDPWPMWQEMVRLVKPGGSVIVDVPQTWNPYSLIKLGHQALGQWAWGWETQYSLVELKAWARCFSLRFKQAGGYGYRGGWFDPSAWLAGIMRRGSPGFWKKIEDRTGAWWMMNVVAWFEKPF